MAPRKRQAILLISLVLGILLSINILGCTIKETKQVIFETIPGNDGGANCYIVGDKISGKAAIIDTTNNINSIEERLKNNDLSPEFIILTHGHFDHIGGIGGLKEKYKGIKVLVHNKDLPMLSDSSINMSQSFVNQNITASADGTFQDDEILELGNTKINVIHTPGHTPGSVTFQINDILFTGDTLFKGSVGRTDFPGSSQEDLYSNIKEKLLKFPDETIIYPGHGESSTIGAERGYFK